MTHTGHASNKGILSFVLSASLPCGLLKTGDKYKGMIMGEGKGEGDEV